MHAIVLYLAAFFVTGSAPRSAIANVDVSVNNGQYLIGVGIGDVTEYVYLFFLPQACIPYINTFRPDRW
jgi:hypothetical protein